MSVIRWRSGAVLLLLLCGWAGGVRAGETTVTHAVGEQDIVVPIEAGYVGVRGRSPKILAQFQTLQEPENRVLDVLLHADDVPLIETGVSAQHLFYQVMTVRRTESLSVSDIHWPSVRNIIRSSLFTEDNAALQDAITQAEELTRERLSQRGGQQAEVEVGTLSGLQAYGEGKALKFWVKMPVEVSVGGVRQETLAITAAAVMPVRGKVITVSASGLFDEDNDGAGVRAALDRLAARIEAVNADAVHRTTPEATP